MAPNDSYTGTLDENDLEVDTSTIPRYEKPRNYKVKWVWKNIFIFASFHIFALYGIYAIITAAKWKTVIMAPIMYLISIQGATAGAHRLWSHRSYKAKLPLRFLLLVFSTLTWQNSIIEWARDHRGHHKYVETDADPHNPLRGFFFSHIGWILSRKHPDVFSKGKNLELSDLYSDPMLVFQNKYYFILMPLACFILPTVAPMYFWNETFINAFSINMLRYLSVLHAIWLVNSVAHVLGDKPYDKFINPSDNALINIFVMGEGWHNYHHVFPWDYRTAEYGKYSLNFTNKFIEFFAKIGWAYDLKTASPEMIKTRVLRTGDGSHALWGWGDKDQPQDDYKNSEILYKKRYINCSLKNLPVFLKKATAGKVKKNIMTRTEIVASGVLDENDKEIYMPELPKDVTTPEIRKHEYIWPRIFWLASFHVISVYAIYLMLFNGAKYQTMLLIPFLHYLGTLGSNAGAHRLWCHRSYNANLPLRILLAFFNCIQYEHSILRWARDHRVHHKYSETDADPHNARRGFFFSHIGWLLVKKHPDVTKKGKQIDMSDLYQDPVVVFQHKYYNIFMPLCCFVLPTVIPIYFWNESFINAFCINIFRYTYCLNCVWFVNSIAHLYGTRPYDKHINPTENLFVSLVCLGEGWHNYHHIFPWDYKASELGHLYIDFSTDFINFFAKLGWAYDLKTVSPDIINKRVLRTGDGSHNLWGWGDKDLSKEHLKATKLVLQK